MRLKQFFTAAAAKRLRAVEADPTTSNQHEFNGINRFREMLGHTGQSFGTVFLYLDDDNAPVRTEGTTTWYNAREHNPDRSAEYRLYFPTTDVSERFGEGDLIIVARRPEGSLLIVATPQGSSVGDQLLWLFGLDSPNGDYQVRGADQIDRDVDYVVRFVLESVGVEVPVPEVDADLIRARFGLVMPSTREFSAFARERTQDCDAVQDPDEALVRWLETEERLFLTFERILVENRLRDGFVEANSDVDVNGFIRFSLGVHNRRKARAGYALENHLEHIFKEVRVRFARGAITERRSRPDFLFPGQGEYLNPEFPSSGLSVLGAKYSCKDRWRQFTREADRISSKHLITLEPSISHNQTDEMRTQGVQLVVPAQVCPSYSAAQRTWLWTLGRFIEHIRHQQT